jgi:hypothetical protein
MLSTYRYWQTVLGHVSSVLQFFLSESGSVSTVETDGIQTQKMCPIIHCPLECSRFWPGAIFGLGLI